MGRGGGHICDEELHQAKGELQLIQDGVESPVEARFHTVLEVTRRQRAKSYEFRAALSLILQWQLSCKRHTTLLIVIIAGETLMPTAPPGPRHDPLGGLLHSQDQPPQEPTNLGDAQREESPRLALNAANELASRAGGRLFFNCSTAMAPARKMVSRARAHIASVICRHHPVQLRTSS